MISKAGAFESIVGEGIFDKALAVDGLEVGLGATVGIGLSNSLIDMVENVVRLPDSMKGGYVRHILNLFGAGVLAVVTGKVMNSTRTTRNLLVGSIVGTAIKIAGEALKSQAASGSPAGQAAGKLLGLGDIGEVGSEKEDIQALIDKAVKTELEGLGEYVQPQELPPPPSIQGLSEYASPEEAAPAVETETTFNGL